MSPSESDLRAALHDGEGATPNVDRLIMTAQTRAAQRRTRLLSTAVVVGIVAAAGVGGGLFASSHSQDEKSSANLHAASGGAAGLAPGTGTGGQAGGSQAFSSESHCPTAFNNAGETTGTKALQRTSMFTTPVSTVVVCAYYDTAHDAAAQRRLPEAAPDQVVLHGLQASRLVQSLKLASTKPPSGACPAIRTASRPVVIVAFTATGDVAGTASTDLGVPVCNQIIVDGNLARYDWSPPAILAPALAKLAPVSVASQVPTASPTH